MRKDDFPPPSRPAPRKDAEFGRGFWLEVVGLTLLTLSIGAIVLHNTGRDYSPLTLLIGGITISVVVWVIFHRVTR